MAVLYYIYLYYVSANIQHNGDVSLEKKVEIQISLQYIICCCAYLIEFCVCLPPNMGRVAQSV